MGNASLTFKPQPPVRIMDPAIIGKFLSTKGMNRVIIKSIKKAISAYNSKCNRAARELDKSFDVILKKL